VKATYTVPKLEDFSVTTLDVAVGDNQLALRDEKREIRTDSDFKAFRDRWLARKNGILTQINELWLKAAPASAKRDVGQRVNEIRQFVEKEISDFQSDVNVFASQLQTTLDTLDVTLPGTHRPLGAEHPIIKTMNDIVNVFRAMGYSVGTGPEI